MFLRQWMLRIFNIIILIIVVVVLLNISRSVNMFLKTNNITPFQRTSFHDKKAGIPQNNLVIKIDSAKEDSKSANVNGGQIMFPENRPLSGYIVYDCSIKYAGMCGGLADRLSGILSTFGLAIISRRHFKIRHDKPCALDNYLEPHKYDWKLNESIIPITAQFMNLIDNNSYHLRVSAVKTNHLDNVFRNDVTLIRMNWDMTQDFRLRPNITDDFPWITKLQYADIYSELYHYLFKPGKIVLDKFADIEKRRKHGLLACSHARAGDNRNADFTRIWKFLSNLDSSKYDIYLASDQQYVRDAGIKYLHGYDVITMSGRLGNIDFSEVGCDAFMTSMVDFYTLTKCDLLVITDSGFSMISAYVRGTSDNLYCTGKLDIFPCSRNTLEDVYPGNMLAPTRLKLN
ncbi:uncharacterized protein LOC117337619 [Pecten maximus]|uniref:uncharacterized protein LOC117337619 n=1 Tax=Pecten maximus TaxID=6579 RepID=UPI0014582E81|nr:uncharacterized protein LOC117337619 [Pecten maximus]XP_033754576.1 uncharacterized protein LOC117337619 [Pecten maximus]